MLPEKKREETFKILQITGFHQKRVLERDFEALKGAKIMKMKCRSVWDHSQGPKPLKMTKKFDFFRISRNLNPENA